MAPLTTEKATRYRQLIRQVMTEHAPYRGVRKLEEFDTHFLCDDEQGHYYLGVPREDIVLGFQAPYKRPYTDFATA